jgi:hypothetical protein
MREGCGETKCPHRELKDGQARELKDGHTDGLKSSPREGCGLSVPTGHLKTPLLPDKTRRDSASIYGYFARMKTAMKYPYFPMKISISP